MKQTTRLNKFIATYGDISRRTAEEYITQERVTVNNKTITDPAFGIEEDRDKVRVDGELIKVSAKKIYILLNKPKKVISTVSDDKHRVSVVDLIKTNDKIFPVGRLDYETTGLILLTNDGDFANKLMHPRFGVKKTYKVKLSKPLEEKHRKVLEKGVRIQNRKTLPAEVRFTNKKDERYLNITIHEGRNRQVRKIFESLGYFVDKLERIKYGTLELKGLPTGQWRNLSPEEVQSLLKPSSDTKLKTKLS